MILVYRPDYYGKLIMGTFAILRDICLMNSQIEHPVLCINRHTGQTSMIFKESIHRNLTKKWSTNFTLLVAIQKKKCMLMGRFMWITYFKLEMRSQ
jgi:hypothetical protein